MNIQKILKELRDERIRLDRAISTLEVLAGTAGETITGSTSRKASVPTVAAKPPAAEKTGISKPMSAATKKRLSELAKQRWAKKKKAKRL